MALRSLPHTTTGGERFVEVGSASTPGVTYRVYPDKQKCSCPARGRCWHLSAAGMGEMTGSYCPDCRGYGTVESYPHYLLCARCDGTGYVLAAKS